MNQHEGYDFDFNLSLVDILGAGGEVELAKMVCHSTVYWNKCVMETIIQK